MTNQTNNAKKEAATGEMFSFEEQENEESETDARKEKDDVAGAGRFRGEAFESDGR